MLLRNRGLGRFSYQAFRVGGYFRRGGPLHLSRKHRYFEAMALVRECGRVRAHRWRLGHGSWAFYLPRNLRFAGVLGREFIHRFFEAYHSFKDAPFESLVWQYFSVNLDPEVFRWVGPVERGGILPAGSNSPDSITRDTSLVGPKPSRATGCRPCRCWVNLAG